MSPLSARLAAVFTLVPFAPLAIGLGAAPLQEPADLVLKNGRIVTLDDEHPEVRALAARDGRIVALGSDAEMAAHVGEDTNVIDLEGQLAIPGFIEGHAHFLGIGDAKMQLDLMHTANWNEIVAMVAVAVNQAKPGELIRGRGWHQEKWDAVPPNAVEGLPIHAALSAASPDNPVILRHASGHATFANAKAMELAGITKETPDPPGGTIVRDANGEAIGMFRETAGSLLGRASLNATRTDPRRLAELATEECLSKGITSFQDAGTAVREIETLMELAEEGKLGVRLWVMLRGSSRSIEEALPGIAVRGYGDDHLTVGGIKHSIDGALGPHGAWMLEPYEDLPESAGLNTTRLDTIAASAKVAIENDLQLCVHAIGDRANREVLDLFERTFAAYPDKEGLRWRIEHAQHLDPDDIPRFGELGVIASMQGVHCTSDAVFVLERLGKERAKEGAYVWRTLLETGAVVTNGTDAPVEDADPIASFYSTVSRRLKDGSVFFPEQRLTRIEALRSYTLDAAYAAFEEDVKGSLTPGKLADVVVLTKDILACPEEEITQAKVRYTIVGGRVAYDAAD